MAGIGWAAWAGIGEITFIMVGHLCGGREHGAPARALGPAARLNACALQGPEGGVVPAAGVSTILRPLVFSAGHAGIERGITGQRRRRTVTTLPRMMAFSAGIGSYTGLCGISQTRPSAQCKVLTVASPSIMATTISPFSAVVC